MAELLRQVLYSRDLVDRGPDHRELQTLGYSDIAVNHLAEMKRDAEVESRVSRRQRAKAAARIVSSGERTATGLFRRTLDAEQAEHGIPDQRDDFAAMVEHRGRRHFKIAAEQIEEILGREPASQFSGLAKIAVPERGRDLFAVATPDQAIEHRLTRALAEIDVGDVLRDASLDLRLQRDAELAGDPLQQRDLVIGESFRPVAEPGADDSVPPDLVEADEKDEIVGAALRVKFRQHIEIEKRGVAGQPAAQHRQPMRQGMTDRASQKPILRAVLGAEVLDNDPRLTGPVHRAGSVERMQDPERHLAAQ